MMTAIQRWYLYIDAGGSEEFLDYKPGVDTPVPSQDLWCKNGDVGQLELLLKRYLEDLAKSRQSRDQAKADLAIADAKIKSLEAEILEHEVVHASYRRLVHDLDVALNRDGASQQASLCDIVAQLTPDGCPSCAEDTERRMEQIKREFP